MPKLITFPRTLTDTRNWLFNYEGHTAEKNSADSTGSDAPGENNFQVQRGSTFITTTGNMISHNEAGGLKMAFARPIGDHFYMTSYCGYCPKNSPSLRNMNYSPIYDGIVKGFSFKYKKFDNAPTSSNKHRFRINKIGVAYRTADTQYRLRDVVSYGTNYDLMNFVSPGTYTGTVTCQIDRTAQPVGLYFQLETQGGGTLTTDGSFITLWDIKWESTETKEALMSPFTTYYNHTPATPRPIWTQ